jgi:hypothetical protein
MEDWKPSPTNPGYLERTIATEKCTVTVLRPVLDDDERGKREARLKAAAESALATYYSKKGKQTP